MSKAGRAMRTIGIAAIGFVLLAPIGVSAQEVEVSANAGWVSQYYYRGIKQKTSSASAGLDVAAGPVGVGVWAADVGDGAEVDLYGSVGAEFGEGSVSLGGTAYLYTGQFDDTYLEANLGAGYGPLSVEFSIGQYENFADPSYEYFFVGVTAEHEGFFATIGGHGNNSDGNYKSQGNYGEVGYGFSAADLDMTISGIVNDKDLSGLSDGSGDPTAGVTLVFGVSKSFSF